MLIIMAMDYLHDMNKQAWVRKPVLGDPCNDISNPVWGVPDHFISHFLNGSTLSVLFPKLVGFY